MIRQALSSSPGSPPDIFSAPYHQEGYRYRKSWIQIHASRKGRLPPKGLPPKDLPRNLPPKLPRNVTP